MASVEKIVQEMKANPANIRFADFLKVCISYFGEPRVSGSHMAFKKPWKGNPPVVI